MKLTNVFSSKRIKQLAGALILTASVTQVVAEGSRDLYPSGVKGYRNYLNSKGFNSNRGQFDPFPTPGIHKVYVRKGETIYMGSSVVGERETSSSTLGAIILRKPNGTVAAQTSTVYPNVTGLIANRQQELAGPNRSGTLETVTNGYTPFTYTVSNNDTGIYEVEFVSFGVGTNIPEPSTTKNPGGTWFGRAYNTNTYNGVYGANDNWIQPIAYGSGNPVSQIAAWDISVGNATTGVLIPGRVYTTTFNATGPNSKFLDSSFYGKFYVLTPQGYTYLVDNNGQNGATYNFFSNNKGLMDTANTPSALPAYESITYGGSFATAADRIWDPRQSDNGTNVTNKIFYNKPDLSSFPDSALTYNSYQSVSSKTWLKGQPLKPEVQKLVSGCDGRIFFESNMDGNYQIFIDANNNGSLNDSVDVLLSGPVTKGENFVQWNRKDGKGNPLSISPLTLNVRVTTAEVHFPYMDVEANKFGFKINRLDNDLNVLPNQDTLMWNDHSVTTTTTMLASSPKRNLSGLRSSLNGHKYGTTGTSSAEAGFFGNNTLIDSWTYVYDNAVNYIYDKGCLTVSGSVWYDVNSNITKNTGEKNVSGNQSTSSTTVAASTPIYVYLMTKDSIVIDRVQLKADGTYTLNYVPQDTTNMLIGLDTTLRQMGSKLIPTVPKEWTITGESVGTYTTTQKSNKDGVINLNTTKSSITGLDFGIQKRPVAEPKTQVIPQPSGGSYLALNGGSNPPILSGTDPEDFPTSTLMTNKTVAITSLPTTQKLVYDNGTTIVEILTGADGINPPSETNPFVISNFNPNYLKVQFTTPGTTSMSFNYTVYDNVGTQGISATYTLSWTAPLSLGFTSFKVSKVQNGAYLTWKVAGNEKSGNFDVYHSNNSKDWTVVGSVRLNNDNQYSFLHEQLSENNYYKIGFKQEDNVTTYSKVINLKDKGAETMTFYCSPNPTSGITSVNWDVQLSSKGLIVVKNTLGQTVYSEEIEKGEQKATVNLSNLPAGNYWISLINEEVIYESVQMSIIK